MPCKVVTILDRGWRYAIAHPTEAARIVVSRWNRRDSLEQQTAEMKALIPLVSAPGAPLGIMTAAHWQRGINLLLKYGQIPHAVPADSVFTTALSPR